MEVKFGRFGEIQQTPATHASALLTITSVSQMLAQILYLHQHRQGACFLSFFFFCSRPRRVRWAHRRILLQW